MSEKKILFTDIDGTLLDDKKELSKKNIEAIERAIRAGHYVVIDTGRPLASAKTVVKKLGLMMSGCYIIAYNGAIVYDCATEQILKKEFLSFECVKELFEKAEQKGIYVQTYKGEEIITEQQTKELEAYRTHTKLSYQVVDDVLEALTEEPQKVILISLDEKEKLEEFRRENMEWQKDKCISFFSCDEYLEYCPLNSTKGSGIEYLCKLLNISMERTIAVGDERNDIPMIQTAHIGVAMKNAKDEVKECADYVTEKTNNESGVAEIIEKFMLSSEN